MTTTTFSITNHTSGLDLGTFTASTALEAVEAMAIDAGYESLDRMADVLETTVDALIADLRVTAQYTIAADAYRIGRECCEFWVDYLDQPGVSGDPNDWELSALDIETAAIELGMDATPEFVAVLEAGFSERRRELSHSEKFSCNIR